MPKWLKIVVAMIGGLVLLCLVAGGGVAWWFNANKDRLRADGQRVMAEAKAFGQGCVW